ncbi:MAG: lipoyl synthase [Candidatus Caenarcaniphilales bacterium]|nr:lipoyl synthase [Candidatus Caenarcaniphilales bacterium]
MSESRSPFLLPENDLPALPKWLRNSYPKYKFDQLIKKMPLDGMTTVCEEAKCPNRGECISRGIVTVMILGSNCTRACTFCDVDRDQPLQVDPDEPRKMLNMVEYMDSVIQEQSNGKESLSYLVITAPTRDDLFDGGASQFRKVTEYLREHKTNLRIELLIPDFQNQSFAFDEIIAAEPDMICFDIQTVKALYKWIRPGFTYEKALDLFAYFNEHLDKKKISLKSGMMLGLGEKPDEVVSLMQDLLSVGVEYMTMGQYLKAPSMQLPVVDYIEEEQYQFYREQAKELGLWLQASPLTRSSYLADKFFEESSLDVN